MTTQFGPLYDADGAYFEKVAGSDLVYGLDWSVWLPASVTVSSSAWSADSGITVESEGVAAGVALVTVSGGTAGQTYWLTNSVTLSDGQDDSRSFRIKVIARRAITV